MKVLILGGHGMAGHMIRDYLNAATQHDVWSTVRTVDDGDPKAIALDARNKDDVCSVLAQIRPEVVINAIGILNQYASTHIRDALYLNALLPHWLDELGKLLGYRLIHISTDCVFSGKKGAYIEADERDGTTIYAQTKGLGEVQNRPHLTIRTSIIGPELKNSGIGLFHWFMQQSGVIYGYRRALWNGVTTLQLAKVIADVLSDPVSGIVHVGAPESISKMALLKLLQSVFDREDIVIVPNDDVQVDKTLVNTRKDFDIAIPAYHQMLIELRDWMHASSRGYSYGF